MKLQIYSVYDDKAGAWHQPFYSPNDAVAVRTFTDAVNTVDSTFNRHPGDYTLFAIGTWDDQKGRVAPLDANTNLGNGLQLQADTT